MTPLRLVGALLWVAGAAGAALKPLDGDLRPSGNQAVAVYKTTAEGDLKINLYLPSDWKAADRRPALVLFFGGGFVSGSPSQFTTTAQYFARRGLVAATAEYRIRNVHQTPPERCAEDAKSAIRWLRMNAGRLGIDGGKVIAGGGSAGATIAVYAAYNTIFEPDSEDRTVSSRPDALVLYNPALGFGDPSRLPEPQRKQAEGPMGSFIRKWSVTKGGPPAIQFFGDQDPLQDGGRRFHRELAAAGTRSELYMAANQNHGFFNDRAGSPWHPLVVRQTDRFLASLGYLKGEPTIELTTNSTASLTPQ